jgi:hypothetical protein
MQFCRSGADKLQYLRLSVAGVWAVRASHARVNHVWSMSHIIHPGVVDAKVGYFGVKSTKVYREQMGTKPAKSRSPWPPVC